MGGFQKVLKGRSVNAELEQLEVQLEAARAEESSMVTELTAISDRTPPEMMGLNISSKRSINLMILAFAQQLYLQFSDSDFAVIVKEASEKSVGSINYGNQHDCAQILESIERRIEIMEQTADFASVLQKRAKLIGEKALFRNDTDVVPVAGTTTTVFDIDDNDVIQEKEAAILGENFWGVSKVLSR